MTWVADSGAQAMLLEQHQPEPVISKAEASALVRV